MIFKSFVIFFVLCLSQECLSKPTGEDDITNGRGVFSTIWDWIRYPFTWLTSGPEKTPIHEPFISSTLKYDTPESIKIFTHNVTVWCNNQTCTTQKCDESGCRNITCNIYETDLMGECRVYNIISTPEEPAPQLAEPAPKPPQDAVAEDTSALEVSSTTVATTESATQKDGPPPTATAKPPLELESFLSATVGSEKKDSKTDPSIEYQEV